MIPRILSVDDSKTIRLILARLLRPFVCEFAEAADGEEGLAKVAEFQPSLIILDHNMPNMDGLTMLQHLRVIPQFKRTPVIMLSAESGPSNIAAAARLGVRDYVTKPFSDDVLIGKIGRIIKLVPREEASAAAADTPTSST